MKKLLLFLILFVPIFSIGGDSEINFSLGFSYLSNYNKFIDEYRDTILWEFNYTEGYYLPMGFVLSFNFETKKGFGLDVNFGPITYSYFRVASYVGEETEGTSVYDIPISISLKYIMFPKAEKSPYFFIGRIKHYARASGFDLWDKEGFLSGVGLRFLTNEDKSIGVEISYDSSELYVGHKIKPYGLMLGLLFTF